MTSWKTTVAAETASSEFSQQATTAQSICVDKYPREDDTAQQFHSFCLATGTPKHYSTSRAVDRVLATSFISGAPMSKKFMGSPICIDYHDCLGPAQCRAQATMSATSEKIFGADLRLDLRAKGRTRSTYMLPCYKIARRWWSCGWTGAMQ